MANTKAKWVSGRLNFYANGVEFSSGGYVHIKNGSYLRDDNIIDSTGAGDIVNYGISVLLSSANATYTLANPVVGIKKILVAHTTFTHTVRATSAVATGAFGVSGSTLHSIILSPTAALSARGVQVHLVGVSTILWEILAGSTDSVTFSTACT